MLAIIAALAAIAITSHADDPPRIRVLTQSWDVNQTSDRKSMSISIYQGERVELTLTAKRGAALIPFSTNAAPVWTVHDWDVTGTWLTVTGTVSSTSTGVIEYVMQPEQTGGLPPGSYRAFCSVTGGVIAAQSLIVLPSALSTEYPDISISNPITNEASARAEADSAISNALALASATLTSNITSVSDALIAETNERASVVSMISSNIASVADALATETNARHIAISEVSSNITAEANTRSDAVSAITGRLDTVETTALTSVSCSGGWYHPDWFTLDLKPYPYHVISTGTTQAQNSVYVNTITVDSAAGYLLSPDILRASSFTGGVVAYTALSNCSIERVSITNYGWDGYSTQQWDAVIFDPALTTGTVAGITCTLNGFQRSTQIVYVTSNLYSYYQYQGDVPGSLRALINTSLAARAANTNKSIKLFADGWPTTWTRNTNCWAYNIDLTCASPWNSQGNQAEKGGTAITRQHVLYAAHYSFTNGARLLFVDATNGLYWRAIVDQRTLALPNCDARIGLLDQPLPESIHPAFLLQPSDNGRFAGVANMSGGLGIRTVHLKAVEANEPKVFAKWACYAISPEADAAYGLVGDSVAAIGRYDPSSPFGAPAIVGDSGQPTFIIVDYFVILYSAFHGAMGGPNYGYLCAYMESAIADMGSTIYTNLHYVNLEAWRDLYLPALP
ncbi:MAG: hypothetical protein PHI93_11710 [Kiritimatiellae bacterium]|nr:hypothetical protein [Kiritimatiellia bacterium]